MTDEERIINRLQNLAIEKSLNMDNCQDIADVYEKHFCKYTRLCSPKVLLVDKNITED